MEGLDRLRRLASEVSEAEIRNHSVVSSLQGRYGRQLRLDVNREWLERWHRAFDDALDAIEAEVAERYVELPTDADGEPMRLGDAIESDCTMPTEVTHMECFWAKGEEPSWTLWWGDARRYGEQDEDWGDFPDDASSYRHHQPDTWERVVEDAAQFGHDDDPSHIDMARFVARCEALAARGTEARDG